VTCADIVKQDIAVIIITQFFNAS